MKRFAALLLCSLCLSACGTVFGNYVVERHDVNECPDKLLASVDAHLVQSQKTLEELCQKPSPSTTTSR